MPENKITIVATKKEATITLQYRNEIYTQKCIATSSGARHEGCQFEYVEEIPADLAEALGGFVAYDLMRALQLS